MDPGRLNRVAHARRRQRVTDRRLRQQARAGTTRQDPRTGRRGSGKGLQLADLLRQQGLACARARPPPAARAGRGPRCARPALPRWCPRRPSARRPHRWPRPPAGTAARRETPPPSRSYLRQARPGNLPQHSAVGGGHPCLVPHPSALAVECWMRSSSPDQALGMWTCPEDASGSLAGRSTHATSPCGSPTSDTRRGVTTRWPQVYTSPSCVSTTVCRFAAATATMPFPCAQHRAQCQMACRTARLQ